MQSINPSDRRYKHISSRPVDVLEVRSGHNDLLAVFDEHGDVDDGAGVDCGGLHGALSCVPLEVGRSFDHCVLDVLRQLHLDHVIVPYQHVARNTFPKNDS